MYSPRPIAANRDVYCVKRGRSPLVSFLLLAVLVYPAMGQEMLPIIEIGAPKPRVGPATNAPSTGEPEGQHAVADEHGAEIGSGSNGEICADGICNSPTSYAAPIESLGTQVNAPVMNTPVTTKMVTRQMLEDQQATTLDQALKNVSGVATAGGGDAAVGNSFRQILIRGFQTQSYFRDGFRVDSFGLNFAGASTTEMANVDSIEVLKGPAAILYGAVEPGGIVNINTKQPLARRAFSLQQQFGSFAAYRTTLDATGSVNSNKDVLYRFIMSYENDGSFRTLDYNRNILINPVVRWNVDSDTWVRASTQFQQNSFNQDWYYVPYFGMASPLWLGRSFNWGPRSPYNQRQNFTEITWRHDFNKDWSIQQTAFLQLLRSNWQNNGGYSTITDCVTPGAYAFDGFSLCGLNGPFTPVSQSGSVILNYSSFPSDNRQAEYATTANLIGHFNTGEQLSHTLLTGADYYRYNFRGLNMAPQNFGAVGLCGASYFPTPISGLYPYLATRQSTDNYGVYLQDQIRLPFDLHLLGGARWQFIDSRTGASDNTTVCGPFSSNTGANIAIPCNFDAIFSASRFVSQRVTPRVGLLWRPLEWLSLYGNFAQSYSPNYDGKLVYGTNDPTPPSAGEQEEAGVKLSLFDNRLQATAAYYHLTKTNIPIGIPNDFNHVMLVGQGRSQGPELDVQGEILPGWSINLAYANTDAITTKSNPTNLGAPVVGQPIPFVPRNIASLSSAYEFKDGLMKGSRIGARYDYTGYLPFFHTANDGSYIYGQSTPSYGLIGLFGAHEFMLDQFKVVAQLNVSNLFDTSYFVTGGLGPQAFDAAHPGGFVVPGANPIQVGWNAPGYNFNVIGAPRSFRGSIRVSF